MGLVIRSTPSFLDSSKGSTLDEFFVRSACPVSKWKRRRRRKLHYIRGGTLLLPFFFSICCPVFLFLYTRPALLSFSLDRFLIIQIHNVNGSQLPCYCYVCACFRKLHLKLLGFFFSLSLSLSRSLSLFFSLSFFGTIDDDFVIHPVWHWLALAPAAGRGTHTHTHPAICIERRPARRGQQQAALPIGNGCPGKIDSGTNSEKKTKGRNKQTKKQNNNKQSTLKFYISRFA